MSPGLAAMASPSSAPSYIARLAPSPANGDIRCAASPSSVTPVTRSHLCSTGSALIVRGTGSVSPSVISAVSRQLALASMHLQHTGLGGRQRDAVLDHNAIPPQPRRPQDIPGNELRGGTPYFGRQWISTGKGIFYSLGNNFWEKWPFSTGKGITTLTKAVSGHT